MKYDLNIKKKSNITSTNQSHCLIKSRKEALFLMGELNMKLTR